MTRPVASLIAALLAVVLLAAVGAGPGAVRPPRSSQMVEGFVGSSVCGECHKEPLEEWTASTHGRAGGEPGPETIIAPFDGRPIRFADAVVTPRIESGGYEFVVERPARPPLRLVVSGVIGRGHMVGGGTQGFVSRFPDGTERFLPFDYSEDDGVWFCNTAFVAGFWVPGADRARLRGDRGWQPVRDDMRLTECGDWPPARILGTNRRFANCQNCHGSQIDVQYRSDLGRYETRLTTLRINCESCHGAGAVHVERARSGALAQSPDLGLPGLDTLGTDASIATCLSCHALKRALADQGPDAEAGYSLGLPLAGDQPYLPDGRIATFGYQQTHRSSACYLSGSMTCVDCHDPHTQEYRDPFGAALESRFDDGQCTACHASKAADPEAHTKHPPSSSGARCVSCHMPYLQHPALSEAVTYGRSDHTIPIPRPGFDESQGLESACAGCHADRGPDELARQVADLWGTLKPHRPEVAALVAARDPGATGDDLDTALVEAARVGTRYGLAKVMAVDAWIDGWATGSVGRPSAGLEDRAGRALSRLLEDSDEDVRAVAAAALHVSRGNDEDVRVRLDGLTAASPDPSRLRTRWATALTQWAASVERLAGPEVALAFLRRAQEVRPAAPETLIALASGLTALGDIEQAVQVYLEALRHDPDDPVALVNLGLGLEFLGRAGDAEAVYERAVDVRPTEAVAHMNLGNARFRRGDLEGAIAAYSAAVRNDLGLARAHFYLGVSLVNSGRPQEGLASLYDALEFAPDDEEIQNVLSQVESALRGLQP